VKLSDTAQERKKALGFKPAQDATRTNTVQDSKLLVKRDAKDSKVGRLAEFMVIPHYLPREFRLRAASPSWQRPQKMQS
jgi:hypothetical protein